MKSSERPKEPTTAPATGQGGGLAGAASLPGAGLVTPSLQFANTAVGDTALALSPSVILTGGRRPDPAREASPAPPLRGEFGPYHIVRQVGAGGMGAVYEAVDQRTGGRVAIKSLLRMGAAEVQRFKYEFRSMAGVGHPNLVTLYELVSHAATWCITMEFVEGVDLCAAVRRPGHTIARVRALVRQLALAVQALHANNLLHRDLKPSNVLVTAGDRVVVLDFGLVAEISRSSFSQAPLHAGTPLYMAPEQCASQLATPASDWYALGVMLYEAVTGRLPFKGSASQIFVAKQFEQPPAPTVPQDPSLAALIAALLRRDPAERAAGAHVLAWCDGVSAPLLGHVPAAGGAPSATVELAGPGERPPTLSVPLARARPPSQAVTRRAPLVGRLAERSVLEHAYEEAAAGRTTCVYLRGPSGAGKTALGQRFLADLDQAGEAVVLSGRCYEHESVPFKAFDSVIDALTDHLLEHPPAELGPLLGAHCGELARLFPVLGRVPAVKEAAQAHTQRLAAASAGGEHESRRRAFAALKRLLYGLAVRRPLVVAIDDLHWSDVDSVRLVSELLAPPDAPPLLLLAAYRSDWPGSALALQELDRVQLRVAPDQNVYRVELGPLAPDDAEALARALLQAAGLATEPWAATIAGESGGNSFLISAIVRHLSHQSGELGGAPLAAGVGLEGLLAARVARLEPGARGLLELVAVAGQPVPADLLAAAQGRPARLDAWLAELHGERLIFLGQRGHERSVECAHDRLREVVVAGLAADARLALHRRLAETAVDLGRDDPEFLARHLHAAGEHAAAASHAVRAAQAAAAALAFDRAADLYLLALRGEPDSWALMCACAEAKVNAGRGAEAAPLYAQASALAPASETHRLRQKACEQYFVVGETERALAVLRALLVDLGIDYPDASDALHRQFLAMVGALARDEPGPPLGPAPLSSRVAVDTLWSATKGFLIHSPVRGAYFAVASALMARELGDEGRVVRGLCILPGVLAREQEPSLFAALEARVERHLAATEDSYLVGLSAIMTAVAASFGHDWGAALHGLEFGGQHLRSHCAGVSWECNFGMLMLMNLLETRGELRSIAHRSAVLGQQAKETGNAMMEFVAAYYSALTLIAADAIPQARDQVRRVAQISEELPSAHLRALMIEVDCDLYVGDVAAAWDRIERAWGYYEQRWVLYARGQRINASGLRGQVALARARQCAGDERAALVAIADGERRNLEAAGTPQARAIAALLRAMAAAANGRSVGAVVHRLHTAVAAFELADMALHAACVTHRLGAWSGGEAGAEMVARSEAFMRLQTVARPLRWVAMVTPCMAPQP